MSIEIAQKYGIGVTYKGDDGGLYFKDEAGNVTSLTQPDQLAKVSSNDTTAGYLEGKLVAGSNVTLTTNNDGGNETLTISAAADNDEKTKVSSNDTTSGYLESKLVAGSNVTLTTNNDGGNETLTIAAAGGVTGFTGSQNTASPNSTVNASRLLVDATSTNADIVLQAKGTGSLLAQLPDSLVSGGNKRGTQSSDLQQSRTSANRVVSGNYSFAAGSSNQVTGNYSAALGNSNTISSPYAFSAGNSNSVSGNYSIALGNSNTCSGSGLGKMAIGISATVTQDGQFGHAAGGSSQYSRFVMETLTIGTGAGFLLCGNLNQGYVENAKLKVETNRAYAFSGLVSALNTSTYDAAGYSIQGVIKNAGGTVSFVGTPTVTVLGENVASWDVELSASDAHKSLLILVYGSAGATVKWGGVVEWIQIS